MQQLAVQNIKKDLFHDVLNTSIDWVWRATPEGVFTYLSPSLKTMTGFEPEDLIGVPFKDFAPMLFSGESIELIIESLSDRKHGKFGNRPRRFELVYKRKDGSEFIGEMCSSPVLNSRGEIIAIQGTTRDITAHRLLVDELRNSIELFSTFFHSNNNPCCMTDLQTGAVMYVNASWLNNFDCSLDDIVGCTLSNVGIFGDAGQAELADIIDRVTTSNDPIQSDINLLTKIGEEQLCSVTSFSVNIAGVERVFTSIVDNTNNARIENELLKVAKLESINTLLEGVAHELSNQLTGVTANLSLARAADSQNESVAYLDKTEAAAAWLQDLTQQLLTLTKIEGSKAEYVNLGDFLRKTVSLCLHGSQVTHNVTVAADLWQLNINSEKINQVICNLVINAKQAMANRGSVSVIAENILLEADTELPLNPGRYVKVSVIDLGIGLSKEMQSKIFSPFSINENNSRGLGLASAKSIIEAHKGHIELSSTSDFGTTFSFYLPENVGQSTLEVVAE